MSKGKYYFSKSLEKGLKILSLFNRETPALTQSAIAKRLDLNMTSTYRYINTLVELKYLEKDIRTKEIRPSILCLLFCTNLMRATDRLRMVREVVDAIHSENNISIDVAFVVDDTLVRIYHRDAEETLTYRLPDFSRGCLYNTALGKAYLSSLPEDQFAKKIETMELIAKTGRTIADKAELIEALKKAKTCGYAVANEEYLPGLLAIGAPLYDSVSGRGVGAVSFDFSVLQHSARDIEAKFGDMVQALARTLSDILPPDN
jgi:DNA-binding IclR family transcriptional regulator